MPGRHGLLATLLATLGLGCAAAAPPRTDSHAGFPGAKAERADALEDQGQWSVDGQLGVYTIGDEQVSFALEDSDLVVRTTVGSGHLRVGVVWTTSDLNDDEARYVIAALESIQALAGDQQLHDGSMSGPTDDLYPSAGNETQGSLGQRSLEFAHAICGGRRVAVQSACGLTVLSALVAKLLHIAALVIPTASLAVTCAVGAIVGGILCDLVAQAVEDAGATPRPPPRTDPAECEWPEENNGPNAPVGARLGTRPGENSFSVRDGLVAPGDEDWFVLGVAGEREDLFTPQVYFQVEASSRSGTMPRYRLCVYYDSVASQTGTDDREGSGDERCAGFAADELWLQGRLAIGCCTTAATGGDLIPSFVDTTTTSMVLFGLKPDGERTRGTLYVSVSSPADDPAACVPYTLSVNL